MEKLKPCPFCGEKNELYIKSFSGWVADAIVCYGCHAIFSQQEITREEDLIEAWNRRAAEVPDKPWNPIKSRPMDDEEREYYSERIGYVLSDDEAVIYDSCLPDDGQNVLVCYEWGGVGVEHFCNDEHGCYFEENGDMDGIVAWMPL